jgi:malonyl CoA-acyl carrier protein transacylase
MEEIKIAFVAPGQGVDDWSSGRKLLEQYPDIVQPIYGRIEHATGVDIAQVGLNDEDVNTSVAQPAAVGIGYAHSKVLESQGIRPDYVIGLSAGEFTVSAIIKSMSLENAAITSRQRGILQDLEAGGRGGVMVAIHREPLNIKRVTKVVSSAYRSNVHNPIMTGFGYLKEQEAELEAALKEQGARVKIVKSLKFPPHGRYVKGTRKALKKIITDRVPISDSETAMISIRNGKIINKARQVRRSLVWQTTQPTRLDLAIQTAIDQGVTEVYPLYPGNTIRPLLGWYANKGLISLLPIENQRD